MLNLLIIEGNVREVREKTVASGQIVQSALYKKAVLFLRPDAHCNIVNPADEDADLPSVEALEEYDGIIWTGSSLNIYENDLAISRQVEFMKRCFEGKIKIFGSCWGLQVAVVAAGGEVEKNTKGREIGIARNIQTTEIGRCHPLYNGKLSPFDAVAIHLDHVKRLPEGAIILSGNEMSSVQAIELKRGPSVFWGVQYHPEFDLTYIASLIQKYKGMIVDEGICPDEAAVDQLSSDFRIVRNDDNHEEIKCKHNMGADVLDPCCRLQEINNWLDFVEQTSN
ncbi:MAG: type 1 glutamine amidotransferase [Emcibacteraceae bacterium]|nr:type 1 glutamine amidotransferase [Emcibacteraceae bacterium]